MKGQELFATRFSGTGAPALPAQGAGSAPGLSTGKSRVSLGKTHQETAENSPGSATKAISSLLCHGDSTELQLQAEDSTILAGKNGVSSPPGLLPGFQHPWMALGSSQEPGSRHRAPQRAFPHYLPTERCYLSLRPASCSIIPEGLPDLEIPSWNLLLSSLLRCRGAPPGVGPPCVFSAPEGGMWWECRSHLCHSSGGLVGRAWWGISASSLLLCRFDFTFQASQRFPVSFPALLQAQDAVEACSFKGLSPGPLTVFPPGLK